jgi:hypothetical protein
MLGGSAGKIYQLLTHYIIERRRDSVSGLDRSSGFALLNPNFMVIACTHRLAFASIMSFAPGRFPCRFDAVVAIVAARAMLRNQKPSPRGAVHPRQHFPNKPLSWRAAVTSASGQEPSLALRQKM